MQFAVRFAATLLAVTWITPASQAAAVLPACVGSTTQLRIPAGATVVDLDGKFVIPGLIDSYVHVGSVRHVAQDIKFYTRESVEQQLRIYAAYGVTAVQVLGIASDADLASVIAYLKQQTGQ